MYPVCNKALRKTAKSKKMAKKLTLCPEHKVLCLGQIQHNVPLYMFSSMVVAASCYGYACHRQGLGSFIG